MMIRAVIGVVGFAVGLLAGLIVAVVTDRPGDLRERLASSAKDASIAREEVDRLTSELEEARTSLDVWQETATRMTAIAQESTGRVPSLSQYRAFQVAADFEGVYANASEPDKRTLEKTIREIAAEEGIPIIKTASKHEHGLLLISMMRVSTASSSADLITFTVAAKADGVTVVLYSIPHLMVSGNGPIAPASTVAGLHNMAARFHTDWEAAIGEAALRRDAPRATGITPVNEPE